MLPSGVDIFVLQRLIGYSDLKVLRRYLAQNDEENQLTHLRGSPSTIIFEFHLYAKIHDDL
jgi:hypothetical protein